MMLRCDGPSWLTKEGIVVLFHADPGLVRLAEEIAAQHPDLGAYPAQINGGNTAMADALRLGIPAITIGGQTRTGDLPHWHQVGDTFDKMNPEVLERAYTFTWAFISALDARAGCGNRTRQDATAPPPEHQPDPLHAPAPASRPPP